MKNVNLKSLILSCLLFFLLLSVAYKFIEWSTINSFVQLQKVTIPQELALVELGNKQNDEITPILEKLNSEKITAGDRVLIYDDLEGKSNLIIDRAKNYKKIIEENRNKYQNYKLLSKLFVGKRGYLFRAIVNSQISYYINEVKSVDRSLAGDYLGKYIFIISRDKALMMAYDQKASVSPKTLYSKYYSEIAPLEKYTRAEYKLPYEETIKQYYQYGYETLQNNKEYLGSYYSIINDYVAEDYESATYKYKKLQNQILKLNVDMDRLANEGSAQSQEVLKVAINDIFTKNLAIQQFRKLKLDLYPFMKQISGWKNDLELCQIYVVKGELLAELSKKPNDSKNVEEYILSLSQIGPASESVDKDFDKSVMKVSNEDKKTVISCQDKESGTWYKFTLEK